MHNKTNKVLNIIDSIIEERYHWEPNGLLSGLGGCSLYFAMRYLQTRNTKHHAKGIEILERIIIETNSPSVSMRLDLGVSGAAPCWLIDTYVRYGLLDKEEKSNPELLMDLVVQSTTDQELTDNKHDLFYGFIGKSLVLMENDSEASRPYVERVLEAISKNSLRDRSGIYWNTPDPFYPSETFEKTLNFGIPHGTLGIILFLLKCCSLYNKREKLHPLLNNSIAWIINKLDTENNELLYQYSTKPSNSGKLGWCYGNQAIAYTLLRFHEIFECERAKAKAYELIKVTASKSIGQSGVHYYEKYGYYDVRVCHGSVSVAYMYWKLYQVTKDENIKGLAEKWFDFTLDNLNTYIPQIDEIAKNEVNNEVFDTSMGFLNGLSGVGLALISFLNPKLSDWDKLLLLDRPGRE